MGDQLTNVNGQVNGNTERTQPAKRRRGQGQNANHPEPGSTGKQNGGEDNGTGVEQITVVPPETGVASRVAQVDGQKKPARRKKKKPAPAPDNQLQFMTTMVAQLLGTSFGIMSTRMGDHWALTEQEAIQLATPTVAILERYGLLSKVAQSSDFIALGIAGAAIFTPRIMFTMEISKKRKEQQRYVQHVQSTASTATGTDSKGEGVLTNDGTVNGANTPSLQPVSKELLDAGVIETH